MKDSGLGRSHSKFGFYECVNVKLVAWDPSRTRDFWWYPYDESLGRGLQPPPSSSTAATRPAALRRGLGPLLRLLRKSLRDAFRR